MMGLNQLIPDGVKGMVFDCDGTVIDTMPIHWRAWCEICQETGLVFDEADFYTLAGVPGKKIISVLAQQQGIRLDPLRVYERKRHFYLKTLPSAQTIPCVVRYAQEAFGKGIPIAVASGSSRSQVIKGLTAAGIDHLFDVILGNEDYINHKPNPDAYLTAASRLGVKPEDCWGFEDTNIGLQSIRRAGFPQAIDVRLMDGYPERVKNKDLINMSDLEWSERFRAFMA